MYMELMILDRQKYTQQNQAEPLVPESSAFDVELAIEKLKSHKTRYLSDPNRID
jgi:hypothetical protein